MCSVLLLWVYIPHQASWKISLTTVGIEPATIAMVAGSIPTVVRLIFQLAWCGIYTQSNNTLHI